MSDLISRSALIEALEKEQNENIIAMFVPNWYTAKKIIREQPTIEAVEVVHGEIITVFEKAIGHQRCSICGNELEWKAYPNYCDNCGAKLKGGAE